MSERDDKLTEAEAAVRQLEARAANVRMLIQQMRGADYEPMLDLATVEWCAQWLESSGAAELASMLRQAVQS